MDIKSLMNWKIVALLLLFAIVGVYMGLRNSSSLSPKNQVVFETSMGDVTIELYDNMPITAGNFKKLVESGF